LGWKGLLFILVGAMMVNLLIGPAFSLIPILIVNHFGGGALELASMESAFGIGMVLGGIVLGVWGGFKRRILTLMVCIILTGIGLTVLGLTPPTAFPQAVGAMFFAGLMLPIVNGSIFAVFQTTVPPRMQGRVTLMMSGSTAMTPVRLAIAGPVSDALGVQIWFWIGGTAMVSIGIISFFTPAVMQIEERTA